MVGYIGVTQLYLVFKTRTRVSCVVSSTCQNTQQIGWGMGYSCILDFIFLKKTCKMFTLFLQSLFTIYVLYKHTMPFDDLSNPNHPNPSLRLH
jgi:hypothetical protein